MKVTEDALTAACEAAPHIRPRRESLRPMLQAALDHLFPPAGDNPLATNTAPDRNSMELNRLRQVLAMVDQMESSCQGIVNRTRTPVGGWAAPDPEAHEILTTLTSVRRLLQEWAPRGWQSMSGERTETEHQHVWQNLTCVAPGHVSRFVPGEDHP